MSIVDIILLVWIVLGAFTGYKEGFIVECFALIGIVLGVLGGFTLMGWAMVALADRFHIDEKYLPYIAFAVVFIAIVIVVQMAARFIKNRVEQTLLGPADQAAGAVLGALKTVFMLSILIWIVDSMHIRIPQRWTADAYIYPFVAGFAPKLTSWIGQIFPIFDDVF